MRVACCKVCMEVVDATTAGAKDGHLYCRDCAKIHDAVMPKVCNACRKNRAIMEHRYSGVCLCERCAGKMDLGIDDEDLWEEPSTY
jgi:hypothetical protein